MKRFTETNKWSDPWFRKLPPELKCLWLYVCDQCDAAGVIDFDADLASYLIGKDVSNRVLEGFGSRIQRLPNGKYMVSKFIPFQYGKLSELCKPHLPIIAAISKHGLSLDGIVQESRKGYPRGMDTPQEKEQEQDKVQETEQEQDKTPEKKEKCPDEVSQVIDHLNKRTGKGFRRSAGNIEIILARLREPEVTLDGVLAMIDHRCDMWLGDEKMEDFLRPATLFGLKKFDGYYGSVPRADPPQDAPEPEEFIPSGPSDKDDIRASMAKAREENRRIESGECELELVSEE